MPEPRDLPELTGLRRLRRPQTLEDLARSIADLEFASSVDPTFDKALEIDRQLGFLPYVEKATGNIFTFQEPPDPQRFEPFEPTASSLVPGTLEASIAQATPERPVQSAGPAQRLPNPVTATPVTPGQGLATPAPGVDFGAAFEDQLRSEADIVGRTLTGDGAQRAENELLARQIRRGLVSPQALRPGVPLPAGPDLSGLAAPQVGPPAQDEPPPETIQQDTNAPPRFPVSFGTEPVDAEAFLRETGQAPQDIGIHTQRDAEIFLASGEGAPIVTVEVPGVGDIDFPAVMTDEEISKTIDDTFFNPLTVTGRSEALQPARDILGQVGRGALGTTATMLEPLDFQARLQQGRIAALQNRILRAPDLSPEEYNDLLRDIATSNETAGVKGMMSRAANDLREGRITEEEVPDFPTERAITAFGEAQGALQAGEEALAAQVTPEFAESLPGQVAQGVGSTTVFLGARAIPVVGPALLPLTAGLIGSGEALERSIAAGASNEEQARAALMGVAPGLTDILPIERLFRPFARVPGFKGGLYAIVRRMVEQGFVEGTQEGVQQAMQNLIQRYEITPEQDMIEGIKDSTIVGFFVGTLFGGVAGATAPAADQQAPGPITPESQALEARILQPQEPSPVVPAPPTPVETARAEIDEAIANQERVADQLEEAESAAAPPKPAKPQIPFTEKQLRGRNRNELERIARQLRLPKSVTHKKNQLLPKKQILENMLAAATPRKAGRTLSFARGPTPLLDFLSRRGGMKDDGGELRAMDLDKFRKPFLKKPYQPDTGMPQDLALEAVIEAGILPQDADMSDLFDAIRGELFGKPAETPEEQAERDAEIAAEAVIEANRRHMEEVAAEQGIGQDEIDRLDDDALAERVAEAIPVPEDPTTADDAEIIEDEVDRITREALAESEEDLKDAETASFDIEDDIPFGPSPGAVPEAPGVPEPEVGRPAAKPGEPEEAPARPRDAGERGEAASEGVRNVTLEQAQQHFQSHTRGVLTQEAKEKFKAGTEFQVIEGVPHVFEPSGEFVFHFEFAFGDNITAKRGAVSKTAMAELRNQFGVEPKRVKPKKPKPKVPEVPAPAQSREVREQFRPGDDPELEQALFEFVFLREREVQESPARQPQVGERNLDPTLTETTSFTPESAEAKRRLQGFISETRAFDQDVVMRGKTPEQAMKDLLGGYILATNLDEDLRERFDAFVIERTGRRIETGHVIEGEFTVSPETRIEAPEKKITKKPKPKVPEVPALPGMTPLGIAPPVEPTTEQTEIGEQFVVPGAERREPVAVQREPPEVSRFKQTLRDVTIEFNKKRTTRRRKDELIKEARLARTELARLGISPEEIRQTELEAREAKPEQAGPPKGGVFDEAARQKDLEEGIRERELIDLAEDPKTKEEAAVRKAQADLADKAANPPDAPKGPEALKDDAPEPVENVRKQAQSRQKAARKSAWVPGRGAKLRVETAKGRELLEGWRVVEVRQQTKEAVIQSIETGRRRTVPLGDLVRDKKHDGPDPTKKVKRARKAPKDVQPLRERPPPPPRDASFEGEPTAAPRLGELINRLRRVLGLVHRQGRLTTPGAIAEFKRRPGVVRTRVMEEIGAFAHEAGHRVDQVYSQVLFPAMTTHGIELEALANERVPEDEALSEGFAEFFRLYIMSPQYAQRAAPAFFNAFETEMAKVAPDVLAEFKEIQRGYAQWQAQPADEAVLSDMASFKDQEGFRAVRDEIKEQGPIDWITNRANVAYTMVVDRTNPIRQAVNYLLKVYENNTGRVLELKAADNAHVLSRLATDAYSRGHMDILYGVTPHNGTEPEGPGLADAFAKAFGGKTFDLWTEAKYKAFGSYLLSRRAIHEWDRHEAGELPNPPTKVDQGKEQHQENVEKLQRKYNQFSEAADLVYEFVNQLWRKKRDAGLITEDQYQAGLEKPDYVPLIRDVSDKTTVDGKNATTGAGAAFKRFLGSQRRVINPLEAIMRDAYMTAAVIAQNDVRGALIKLADIAGPGSGAIIEEIPAKEIKATHLNVKEIATALKKDSDWEALDDRDAATLEAAIGIIDEMDIPMISVFRAANAPERQEPIIYHWDQGERRAYRLADKAFGRLLYNSITGLDRESRKMWINVMSYPASWLRLGVTTEPSFFFANLVRDQLAAWVLTDVGFKPGWSWGKGLVRELSRSDMARLYNVFGGIMGGANVAALNKGRIQRDFRAARKAGLNVRRFTNLRALVELSELSETSTRLGIFELAFTKAKKRGLNDREALIEAAFIARDFIDFGRHGAAMLPARRIFTFLNAGIQGLDKSIRVLGGQGNLRRAMRVYLKSQHGVPLTATEKRELKTSAKAWVKIMEIGMLGLALSVLYRDDPEYNTFSDYLRATHWMAKIGGQWISIPKPFELAFMSNILERSFDVAYRDDPKAMERMRRGLWLMVMPPVNAPIVSVPIGAMTNYDFFRERPLIPEYLQAREPWLRYNSYTSDFSKWLARPVSQGGAGLNVPPILIDYYITGLTGSWGRSFLTATSATTADDPALGLDDLWVVRRFARDPNRGNIATKEFWDTMNDRGGEMFSAFASYEVINQQDEEAGRKYLRGLPEHRQIYTIWRKIAVRRGRGERKIHPMERAADALRAIYNARDTLREAPISDFTAEIKQHGDDLLADLGTIEAHNAMVVSQIPGWKDRPQRDQSAKLEEIRQLDPKLADLVNQAYGEKRVPDWPSVRDTYPTLRQSTLQEVQRILGRNEE